MVPTAQKQRELKQRIHQHLTERGVFADLKQIVNSVLGDGATPPEARALAAATQSDVLSQMVVNAADAPTSPLDPSRSHLHVTLLGGRAFAEPDELAPADSSTLRVWLQFGSLRFRSAAVPHCPEPEFAGSFVIELPEAAEPSPVGAGAGVALSRARRLVACTDALHVLVTEHAASGRERILSSLLVEWRKVLHAGRCVLSVELPGVGEHAKLPVGSLELRLDLLPAAPAEERLTEGELLLELKRQRGVQTEVERRFISYARGWWASYLALRSSHRGRHVQLFALTEMGVRRPVTCFVRPLRAGRMLDSALHAAHFVSLIPFERSDTVGAAAAEIWQTSHSTLAARHGDAEEHALLLASLLLGFGLEAYVCLGEDASGAHVWVMTRADGAVTFWEATTGARFAARGAHPYRSLSCVFCHDALYANAQPSESLGSTSLKLEDPDAWRAMDPQMLAELTPLPQASLRPSSMRDHGAAEATLEAELRASVEAHRLGLGLPSRCDEDVCAISP